MEEEQRQIGAHGGDGGPHHTELGNEDHGKNEVQERRKRSAHRNGARLHRIELVVHREAVEEYAVLPDDERRQHRYGAPVFLGRKDFQHLRRHE